jgi:hypothetical protein
MDLHLTSIHVWAAGIGFFLGFLLFVAAARSHWKTSREFRRFKKMLTDKMDLDSKQQSDLTRERDRLKTENENLRLQVARLNDRTDNRLHRELEIYARAEKQMNISAPGFAPAWEIAKANALTQLAEEEKGNSFPQRMFRKLVGGNNGNAVALPAEAASKAQNSAHSHADSAA